MPKKDSFDQLLVQYATLCRYCDEFFMRALEAFQEHMQCAQGCTSCCVLETVTPLEAFVIESFLKTSPVTVGHHSPADISGKDQCIFLYNNTCAIYPVRPVICRTHGLPLLYATQGAIEICPLNFITVDLTALDSSYLLDAESITTNLMRLNLAFCMLTGNSDTSGERIPLQQLI